MEIYSGGVKRVCRSTLAAEANGFLAGAEAGDYLRHARERILNLDLHYVKNKLLCLTDQGPRVNLESRRWPADGQACPHFGGADQGTDW